MRTGTTIPIRGRYGISCKLKKLSKNKFKFQSTEGLIRFGGLKDNPKEIGFVDPSGGPMLSVGDELPNISTALPHERITKIESTPKGLIIHTENIEDER